MCAAAHCKALEQGGDSERMQLLLFFVFFLSHNVNDFDKRSER